MASEILHVTATPSSFTSGNFPLTTMQSGPAWAFTWTPAAASTAGQFSGFEAFAATNDNGGLYQNNRRIELYNGSGSGTLVAQSSVLTWSASQAIRVVINLAAGTNASSMVISGATTGNGTTTFTTTGTYFTASTLGIGQFTSSNTFVISGTISSLDDNAAASASGTGAVAGITGSGAAIPGTFASGSAQVGGITGTGLTTSPGTASGTSQVGGITGAGSASSPAVASGSGSVGGITGAGVAGQSLFGTIGASSAGQRADQTGPATGTLTTAFVARTPSTAVLVNDRLISNGRRYHVNAAGVTGAGGGPSGTGVQADGTATLVALQSTDPALTMTTQPSNSVMVAIVMRENWNAQPAAPTDNKGNTYTIQGAPHFYAGFPSAASALYACANAIGGAGHFLSAQWAQKVATGAELTVLAVEVPTSRSTSFVQSVAYVERTTSTSLTSASVTTTGPAMLIAALLGTGNVVTVGTQHTGTPTGGFTSLPNAGALTSLHVNGYVQGQLAFLFVTDPGTYTATWTTSEGAEMYLVAIQEAVGTTASGAAQVGGITGAGVAGPSAAGTSAVAGITGAGFAGPSASGAAAVGGITGVGLAGSGTAAAGTSQVGGVTGLGFTIAGTFASGSADVGGISGVGLAESAAPGAASGTAEVGGITGAGFAIPGTLASGASQVGGIAGAGSAARIFASGSAQVGGITGFGLATSSLESVGPPLVLRATMSVENALLGTFVIQGATLIAIVGSISVYQGDTLDLVLVVTDDAGEAVDLTDAIVEVQVKAATGVADPPLITKALGAGIALLDQGVPETKGQASCSFSSADTSLPALAYAIDAVVVLAGKRQHVVPPMAFGVLPVINAP